MSNSFTVISKSWLIITGATLVITMTKHLRKLLRGGGIYVDWWYKDAVLHNGEGMASGAWGSISRHVLSHTAHSEKTSCLLYIHPGTSDHRMMLSIVRLTFRNYFLFSIDPLWTDLHRRAMRYISKVMLNSIKFTVRFTITDWTFANLTTKHTTLNHISSWFSRLCCQFSWMFKSSSQTKNRKV